MVSRRAGSKHNRLVLTEQPEFEFETVVDSESPRSTPTPPQECPGARIDICSSCRYRKGCRPIPSVWGAMGRGATVFYDILLAEKFDKTDSTPDFGEVPSNFFRVTIPRKEQSRRSGRSEKALYCAAVLLQSHCILRIIDSEPYTYELLTAQEIWDAFLANGWTHVRTIAHGAVKLVGPAFCAAQQRTKMKGI